MEGTDRPRSSNGNVSQNYKVFADIGRTSANSVRTFTIDDTVAGPKSVRKDTLPIGNDTYLKSGHLPNIYDANVDRIDMHGVVTLQIEQVGLRCQLTLSCAIAYRRSALWARIFVTAWS